MEMELGGIDLSLNNMRYGAEVEDNEDNFEE